MVKKLVLLLSLIYSNTLKSQVIDSSFIKCNLKYHNDCVNYFSNLNDTNNINRVLDSIKLDWVLCNSKNKIPNFASNDLDNNLVSIEKIKGKVIVLNFWYLGCPPCMAEIPMLNKLFDEFRNCEIEFISITFDSKAALLKREKKLKLKIIPDGKNICNNFGITGYPQTFIISKNHNAADIYIGANLNDNELLYKNLRTSIIRELKK
jgi:peroxiredoxin